MQLDKSKNAQRQRTEICRPPWGHQAVEDIVAVLSACQARQLHS